MTKIKYYILIKLRKLTLKLEEFTSKWVISEEEQIRLFRLIENTKNPDFSTFDIELNKIKKRWSEEDPEFRKLEVTRRWIQFKHDKKS